MLVKEFIGILNKIENKNKNVGYDVIDVENRKKEFKFLSKTDGVKEHENYVELKCIEEDNKNIPKMTVKDLINLLNKIKNKEKVIGYFVTNVKTKEKVFKTLDNLIGIGEWADVIELLYEIEV